MGKTAKELMGSTIKCKVRIAHVRYPSSGHASGDWAAVSFEVAEIYEGEIPDEFVVMDMFGSRVGTKRYEIVATGNMPKLKHGADYILDAKLVMKRDKGPQYEVISMRFDYDLTDDAEKRVFFTMFTSESIADALLSGPDDPIDLLERKDIGKLKRIKGIGPVTAMRLCQRYEENKDHSRAYVALRGLGLTKNAIDRLIARYKSPDVVIEKVDSNLYILIREVRGFGWERCDKIASAQGFAPNCRERVVAYINYYLYMQAEENGNSWVTLDDLAVNVATVCAPLLNTTLAEWIKELIIKKADYKELCAQIAEKGIKPNFSELPLLYYNKENRRIYEKSLRLRKLIFIKLAKMGEGKTLLKKILKPAVIGVLKIAMPMPRLLRKIDDLSMSIPYDSTPYVGCIMWDTDPGNVCRAKNS